MTQVVTGSRSTSPTGGSIYPGSTYIYPPHRRQYLPRIYLYLPGTEGSIYHPQEAVSTTTAPHRSGIYQKETMGIYPGSTYIYPPHRRQYLPRIYLYLPF